jgi:hypothetical protein
MTPNERAGTTIDVEASSRSAEAPERGKAVAEYREPAVPANPFDVEPAAFQRQITQRGENYQALVGWLVGNMVEGEDVVSVHVTKRDDCQFGGPAPRGNCSAAVCPWHWSDPDLSKKGAEKICGLLGLGTRFLGMSDFQRAALKGMPIEHVIIDCELYAANGSALSQGTGACSLSEVKGNLNAAMKKACKRAHVDAVKRCAGLSGLATEIKKRNPPVDPEAAAAAARNASASSRARGENKPYATGRTPDVCPIGKHKGALWRDVPSNYLEWVVRELTGKPDLVEAASKELARRRGEAAELAADMGRDPGEDDEDG